MKTDVKSCKRYYKDVKKNNIKVNVMEMKKVVNLFYKKFKKQVVKNLFGREKINLGWICKKGFGAKS